MNDISVVEKANQETLPDTSLYKEHFRK